MIDKREITPELLSRLTALIFTKIPAQEVLAGHIRFDSISRKNIAQVMMEDSYFNQSLSELECKSYAQCVIDYVNQKSNWQRGHTSFANDKLNVFDLLVLALKDLLVMNQNRIECRYEDIFSWRHLVRFLGEELPLSIRYAYWDYEHGKSKRYRFDEFAWPYVTPHNNKQLNMIIRRGISDHHCHLWASTPYFHVSWVNLMNRLTNIPYERNLQRLNPPKWSLDIVHKRRAGTSNEAMNAKSGVLDQLRAAWIRLYLCERITGSDCAGRNRSMELENVRCSENWRMLLMSRGRLQSELEAYAHSENREVDYILSMAKLKHDNFSPEYRVLVGERWLYYSVFADYCKPCGQRRLCTEDYNLFFCYFLIRSQLRNLMVQTNDFIGFDNFQQFERRKAYFLDDPKSEQALVRLTINETLKKSYVKELEVRLTPDAELVHRMDQMINSNVQHNTTSQLGTQPKNYRNHSSNGGTDKNLTNRYYYVFHFLKRYDPSVEGELSNSRVLQTRRICRHSDLRHFIMNQAKNMIRLRESRPFLACRILGIDAASQEIGCRPEVFGPVYRLLGEHQCCYGGIIEPEKQLPALGKTYHVGEGFPDIVDGLRAIDEVIQFLDFDCGDRLGHAVVLGTNVEEWYKTQHCQVSVSVQDYLDNLAWLYHALNHFFIPGVSALKERIIKDFEYWFRIVYRNSISDNEITHILRSARINCYDRTGEDNDRYHNHTCHFNIMDYYRAWTLRGDDPMCYVNGYFEKPFGSSVLISGQKCKVNETFPVSFEDRYVPEYSLLNYLYQFDSRVRREGSRRIIVNISDEYIRSVKAIQIEMRYRIARKGISIETNPTSNVLIGTFRKYEKHPILSFFNRGLPISDLEEQECAQNQVSINTDDRGVFYTDMETEYALLARSVENIVDTDGKQRFKKNDIYTWLDNIRIMGNEQTFKNVGGELD